MLVFFKTEHVGSKEFIICFEIRETSWIACEFKTFLFVLSLRLAINSAIIISYRFETYLYLHQAILNVSSYDLKPL